MLTTLSIQDSLVLWVWMFKAGDIPCFSLCIQAVNVPYLFVQWTFYITQELTRRKGKIRIFRRSKRLFVLFGLDFIPAFLILTSSWHGVCKMLPKTEWIFLTDWFPFQGKNDCSLERAIGFPLTEVCRDHSLLQHHDEIPLRGALLLCLHRPEHPSGSLYFMHSFVSDSMQVM